MRGRIAAAVWLLGTIPAIGSAQFSKGNIERFDPVKLLLDNRKELKLDVAQRAELEKQHVPVKWNIKKLAARIDSAQRDMEGGRMGMRGARGGSTSEEPTMSPEALRARILAAHKVITDAVAELQREHEQMGAQARAVLTEPQRAVAAELFRKRGEDLRRMVDDAGFGAALQRGSARGGG